MKSQGTIVGVRALVTQGDLNGPDQPHQGPCQQLFKISPSSFSHLYRAALVVSLTAVLALPPEWALDLC